MMAEVFSRDVVVQNARTWLGTPYRHQHATKGAGCDCLGLILGVYKEIAGRPLPKQPPKYSASWGEGGDTEFLLDAANQFLVPSDGNISPGNVLIFRMFPNSIAKHCGIATSENSMIHAYNRVGTTECSLVSGWRSKIVGIFDFPGVYN